MAMSAALVPTGASANGDPGCETTGGVSAPSITHALVLFGGPGSDWYTYKSANHTFGGGTPGINGLAINGNAGFPNYSTSFDAQGATNYIIGGYTGVRPTANNGSWYEFDFPYTQQEWIEYAAALADAAEADPAAYSNVRVYRPNGGTVTITNDGPDYPSPPNQPLHVVVGEGTVFTTQGQNDKTDGAIIAPEAKVDVDKQISHVDGFVVAAQFIESYAGPNLNNTGLQVHGQSPDAFVDVPGECVSTTTTTTTTTPTTTTTTAPTTTTTTVAPPTKTTSPPTTTTVPTEVLGEVEIAEPADPVAGTPIFTG